MTNQPITKLKDGLITATIWKNQTSAGKAHYSVTFARSYMKNDEWSEAYSFSGSELLRISRLSQAAYTEIQKRKRASVEVHAIN
jgi:hypothetical protein